jgi:Spy/CpxP family protein refolding chaperone
MPHRPQRIRFALAAAMLAPIVLAGCAATAAQPDHSQHSHPQETESTKPGCKGERKGMGMGEHMKGMTEEHRRKMKDMMRDCGAS